MPKGMSHCAPLPIRTRIRAMVELRDGLHRARSSDHVRSGHAPTHSLHSLAARKTAAMLGSPSPRSPRMSRPTRYDDLDFTPPPDVARAAKRGLELRGEHDRGGTQVGVARARDLSNRRNVSPDTVRRMVSYFARHEVDRKAEHWADEDAPSAGFIAWQLWGGDPGRDWADALKQRMDAADEAHTKH